MAKTLSENAQKVLGYVQDHKGEDITYTDIADALDLAPRSVTGVLTALQKKGFILRQASDDDAKVKYIRLTDEGAAIDPAAELPETE